MSGGHDTDPPPPADETIPPESVGQLPIRAGEAANTMLAALANLAAAVVNVERTAMACARAVDATSEQGGQSA